MIRGQERLIVSLVLGILSFLEVDSYTVNRFGDVIIRSDTVNFQCDLLLCPPTTARCQVTKSPADSSPTSTIRQNICFDEKGAVLLEKTIREPRAPGVNSQLNVVVDNNGGSTSTAVNQIQSSGGSQSTANDGTKYGEDANRIIQQNVRLILDEVDKNLKESLGGLWKGFS